MICPMCGVEFAPRYKWQKYCNSKCALKANPSPKHKPAERTERQCVICGKTYKVHQGNQRTCGAYECRKAYAKRNAKVGADEELIWQPICQNCGKEFKPAYEHEHFCSDKCRFQFFHLEKWYAD